jgi:ABC-type transporter Mla MlaB component
MVISRNRAVRPFSIEAHPSAATLYLHGATSVAGLLEAMQQCDALPQSVWLLRVAPSSAHPLDAGTLTVLAHALRRWREARSGATHVPPELRGPSLSTRVARWRVAAATALRDRFVVGA